ncbi:DEKNAAC104213 [Brettanomyces naardenensis]|uniref:mitogen-activated protein kinase kinase n=1 Tax=Brettanomyces naardenensis TaxID=13370 RepID=A0A448YQ13_BRENA|nr:DEKNAAC104213 [Brettanomyces naardenensis]
MESTKYAQHVRTSSNLHRSKRPPPLVLKSLSSTTSESYSPVMESPDPFATPQTPFYEKHSNPHKVIVSQEHTPNMISARSRSFKAPDSRLESRSLSRRNVKKLTLSPLEAPDTPTNDHLEYPTSAKSTTSEMSLSSIYHNDPERKASTDELIHNIQHLELGVEYQVPIKAEELVQLKKLGSGNSGTVSKMLHLPTQKIMARKIIHLEAKEVVQSQIIRELRIMHECDSPFIIGFYGAFLHEGDVVICMEYVDCGSFDKILKLTGPLPEFMLKHVAYSVLSGLNYLYDTHRIIHRDVKPSNVLLDSKGNIKLCDFGVSKELINSMADTFVGTSTYMSPERIQGGVYTVKGDVWSLGIMLYELASGKQAYSTTENPQKGPDSILELLQRVVNEKPPTLSVADGFCPELCDFVAQCLKKENDRPGPRELMEHAFLTDFIDPDGFRVSQRYRGEIKRWAKNVRRVQKGKPVK